MNSTGGNAESQKAASRGEVNNDLPIRFAGSTLGARHHICAFFGTPDWNSDDANRLLQYEANFNLAPRNRDPVICSYDFAKHSAVFIIDVMRTHPMMIIGGILQENPFYVPPEEFVRQLRAREATSQSRVTSAA
jgi:hypothetical protein